ncbi:DinB family protein [Nocardia cyriacigeorgica]|uniref:DinB family protein n=1 Tax=Nocardia cyriacigeorgica TaxID=135487 RepID=A0A6P1DGS0_9NOCA|nr:DinB family protein [Nocardia cyriacigeorgica]NEW38507.1 DinB family protein [Nocardia cyriacigeorgica]NEW47572.1 DinB family protein [Nocardia cyriacigeorgica]NEW49535.1 DinB family protein [Nocardia cyriacigeorgica]
MTATPTSPTTLDAERSDLLDALAAARSALIQTVRGLTDEQAGLHPTASELCLGGLIKHVASMEEAWIRFVVDGPSAMRYDLPEGVTWADIAGGTAREFPQWMTDHAAEFQMQPADNLTEILARYERIAARTEEIITAIPDLSAKHPLPEAPWHEPGAARSVRGVLAHLIAEIAQHAGHADILRETLDGETFS